MSRIIRLQAENYKMLKAVEIRPDGNIVTISGRNRQGKTSILDSVAVTLQGGRYSRETSQPIRDGQDVAVVVLEIGNGPDDIELVVTRRWTKDDSGTLTVESADGAKYSSPQKLLDEVVGRLSFDPALFIDLSPADQVNALVDALGDALPFDPAQLAVERAGVFDRRTEITREVKKLEGQIAGYPSADPSLPAEEIAAADIIAELSAAAEHNRSIERSADLAAELNRHIEGLDRHIADLKSKLLLAETDRISAFDRREAAMVIVTGQAPIDSGPINERLGALEATNRRIRQERDRNAVAAELSDRKQEAARQTVRLQQIDKQKADGIASAKFPVPELSFDDSGVTYSGVPFKQASTAEQLRASFGVALAANPKLRVCRIDRGESLDAGSLALLADLAAEYDMQVWLSVVTDSGVGFVVEEGEIVA